ncbi:hypothetical protein FRC12_024809 [Ceratobasidium sp. 428]|nr:hypothetical protein FRC12_024809 [Ceratobasidium sp. 428]
MSMTVPLAQARSSSQSESEKSRDKRQNVFQRVYSALGFKKGYNFILWFIFGGAMVGFALARFMYLHAPTLAKGLAPGEGYHMLTSLYKPAMLVHIGTVLPAGIFAVLQFIPQIRYKALIVHRILGYVALLLLIIGASTGFVLGRRSFGGDMAVQTGTIFLGAVTLISAAIAYYNIKRLQINEHRKWMLRTWFYAGTIITTRLVMLITAQVLSAIGQYHTLWTCDEVQYVLKDPNDLAEQYPGCVNGQAGGFVGVPVKWSTALPIGSALRASFGAALWVAFLIHAVGIEIYIHLTPGEDSRLRKVSYERQLERGAKHPGSMGTTSDRLGDNFGVYYKPE